MDAESQACIEHGQHEPAHLLSQAIRCGIDRLSRMEIPIALRREALMLIRETVRKCLDDDETDTD
jgi:hypothetical protein